MHTSYQEHSYTSQDHIKYDHRLTSNISQRLMYMREAHPLKHMMQIQRYWKWYVTQMKHARCIEMPNPNSKWAKDHKTHKLPLNSCNRAKENTKLALNTCNRAKSKRDQVARQEQHIIMSQIYLPWLLILIYHPWKWCTPMKPPRWG
jgi:hypothetical protein